jgi:hypothetical protein
MLRNPRRSSRLRCCLPGGRLAGRSGGGNRVGGGVIGAGGSGSTDADRVGNGDLGGAGGCCAGSAFLPLVPVIRVLSI